METEQNQLFHVHLISGEDILCYANYDEEYDDLIIIDPVLIENNPKFGIVLQKWLLFSKNNTRIVSMSQIMGLDVANDYAIKMYYKFMNSSSKSSNSPVTDNNKNNLIDEAMLESKVSVKH